jgi:hypothetical protein
MPSFGEPICRILGDDQVRSLIQRRRSGERLTYDDFLDCFQRQLEGIGYSHTHHTSAMNSVESVVYHVVYASRNPLGREFYAKASSRRSDGQIVMPLFT